jgi:hypothetical protein
MGWRPWKRADTTGNRRDLATFRAERNLAQLEGAYHQQIVGDLADS